MKEGMALSEIIVEQGNEFRIYNYRILPKDIFIKAYHQAAQIVEEIVIASLQADKEDKAGVADYLNNIIAFTGERGQGKSSAMVSFTNTLTNPDEVSDYFQFHSKTRKCVFKQIGQIDPSSFDSISNILEVIVARLFKEFEILCKCSDSNVTIEDKNQMFLLFGRVYQNLCLSRNIEMRRNIEQDYESNLQELSCMSDGTSLRDNMLELIKHYLNLCKKTAKSEKDYLNEYFLVVPIDDLDINIDHAFQMAEQIRKYLMIPHVIIIMAMRIEQLKMCVEKKYWSDLSEMRGSDRLNPTETATMAAKYVDKLIPDGRKIALPNVQIMEENFVDPVLLIYGPKKDGTIHNILQKYAGKGIQETILRFIYDQTGIAFIPPQKGRGLHPIIPQTLRELVSLLCVLGKMKDLTNQEDPNARLDNLNTFETFLINTWVPNYLDYGNSKIILELYQENTFRKHLYITNRIMDIIENTDSKTMYTLDPRSPLMPTKDTIEVWKDILSRKKVNPLSHSVGDILSLLNVLSHRFVNEQAVKLVFAIKTSYTLIMHKLLLTQDTNALSLESNKIHKFVGDSLWGYKTASTLRDDRGAFSFSIDKSYNTDDIILMAAMCDFPNKDSKAGDIIYEQPLNPRNNQKKESAYFHIDNLLITCIDTDYLPQKIDATHLSGKYLDACNRIKQSFNRKMAEHIIINFEVMEYIQSVCAQGKDIKSEVKSASEYMRTNLDILDSCFSKLPYYSNGSEIQHLIIDGDIREQICSKFEEFDAKKGDLESQKLDVSKRKYINKINSILENPYTGKLQDIRVITKECTVLYLRNHDLNLARNIAFHEQSKTSPIQFSSSIKIEVQDLYVESALMVMEKGNSEIISSAMLGRYNGCAREILNTIDNSRK